MDEEFESLREKSARASTVYDDLESEPSVARTGGLLAGLSPSQRLLLAFLVFIDILALACVVLAYSGRLPLVGG
ncbi:MAG: hypothetical protein ACRDHL_01480 [Candidatus Promineifilaceae bacterium]